MNKQIIYTILLLFALKALPLSAQVKNASETPNKLTKLFSSDEIIHIRLSYSNKIIKKQAGDTLFVPIALEYQEDGTWKNIKIGLRGRGNFRLKNCYFSPLKVEVKKTLAEGTLFKGNKKLKMVLPCMLRKGNDNKVIKEYIAYKIFEQVSPFHFKTRLLEIDYTDIRNKKTKHHKLKGFIIEDDKVLAKRHNGKAIKDRKVHPMAQDTICQVRNAFFQYMIGNTDYSTFVGHNEKLLFIDKQVLPVPYDFDMSGLVNTGYSVVSVIGDEELPISNVTERMYRGFKRSDAVFEIMRQEYLGKKVAVLKVIDDCEHLFDNANEFDNAKAYISEFFTILQNKDRFKRAIVNNARKK